MADDQYPSSDQVHAKTRRFEAEGMEEEAKVRDVFGDKEQRKHEQDRLNQEWEKIGQDKGGNLSEKDVWSNHVRRMRRMSATIKDTGKALRRAQHFEAAGLGTASALFSERAQTLAKKESNVPVVKGLARFNAWVVKGFKKLISFEKTRKVGERWMRAGGYEVTKLPSGEIVRVPTEGQKEKSEAKREALPKREKGGRTRVSTVGREREVALGSVSTEGMGFFKSLKGKSLPELQGMAEETLGGSSYRLVSTYDKKKFPMFHVLNGFVGQMKFTAGAFMDRGSGAKAEKGFGHSLKDQKFWTTLGLTYAHASAQGNEAMKKLTSNEVPPNV